MGLWENMELDANKLPRLPLRENATGQALLLTSLAMMVLGVVMVHSAMAVLHPRGAWYSRTEIRHTIFAGAALLVLLGLWPINYRVLAWRLPGKGFFSQFPVIPTLALLAAMAFGALVFSSAAGREVGGRARWVQVGASELGAGFQPSELIKYSLLIFLAAWLSHERTNVRSFFRTFLPALLLVGVSMGLVVSQNLSTAVVIGIGAGASLLLAGVPWYYLMGVAAVGGAGAYGFLVTSEMRMQRIQAFLNPWVIGDATTHQPRQSLLAILTGGVYGKGLGHGIIKLGFLPEGETDFIFSVFCEEAGLIGAAMLVGLLLLWIFLARRAAVRSGDSFGRLLAGSIGFVIGLQAVLHIAVDTVAAPPTGVSLPFISAGGTALIATAAATALIISVTSRRGVEEGLAGAGRK